MFPLNLGRLLPISEGAICCFEKGVVLVKDQLVFVGVPTCRDCYIPVFLFPGTNRYHKMIPFNLNQLGCQCPSNFGKTNSCTPTIFKVRKAHELRKTLVVQRGRPWELCKPWKSSWFPSIAGALQHVGETFWLWLGFEKTNETNYFSSSDPHGDILFDNLSGSLSSKFSDIPFGISSHILSGISSGTLSAYLLTFYLAYLLAFYLEYFLAFFLPVAIGRGGEEEEEKTRWALKSTNPHLTGEF